MKIVVVGIYEKGQGKAVLEIIKQLPQYEVVAFLDDDPSKWGRSIWGIKIIGGREKAKDLVRSGIEGAIITTGDNHTRQELAEEMLNAGLELINAIHPAARIATDVKMGKGNAIFAGAIIGASTVVGNNVIINNGAIISHDNIIEDGVNVSCGAVTGGRVRIKENAFIGLNATILPDRIVGQGSIVGAGAVVTRDVKDNDIVAGVPAKSIRSE
ncbi:acetyltransferase [Candidatus Aerophobetes bacterium]|nr:acetyltransferase [Candidatus Aerophobetes bacterium]